LLYLVIVFTVRTVFTPLTPDQDYPSDQAALDGSATLSRQVGEMIQLVRSGEKVNIKLALLLAEGLGHPPAFQQYLEGLLPLYQLAFESQPKKADVPALTKLFQLKIPERGLTALPESLGALQSFRYISLRVSQFCGEK
jgi:hypothetical protein